MTEHAHGEGCMFCDHGEKAVEEKIAQDVREHGMSIIMIPDGEPTSFAYTTGRTSQGKSELFISGWPQRLVLELNTVHEKEAAGEINLEELLELGDELTEIVSVPLRLRRINAYDAEMFVATNSYGMGISAIQLVWPDDQGLYPEDEGYASDVFLQHLPLGEMP